MVTGPSAPRRRDEPPVPTLTDQLCFAVYATDRAMASFYRRLLRPFGLTQPQYLVMLVLWEHHIVTVGELGQRLHLDSGTLSPLLRRLENSGLIRRRRRPLDERIVEIAATRTGWSLRDEAANISAQVARASGMKPDEITSLRNSLQVLTMRMRAAETPSHPPAK